jgi:F-type H+-transporting ATPase subunit delta
MQNPRLANRYAKSLIDLSIEKNELEAVYADMKYMQAVCVGNRDFVNLLKSPIIKADKKSSIINAVTVGKVTEITKLFNQLLITKGRESELPEIVEAFIEQYNAIKGIHIVTLTTATEISDAVKANIEQKVKQAQGIANIELHAKVDESIIGGFVLEFNNNLVDASISRDLRDVKKQFEQNVFVANIR